MTHFERGDVVRVMFPHVERNVRRARPALVLTREPIGPGGLLIWAAMITNAARDRWPGDVLIADREAAGLPVESIVRTAKIATLEAGSATKIGQLGEEQVAEVGRMVANYLRVKI